MRARREGWRCGSLILDRGGGVDAVACPWQGLDGPNDSAYGEAIRLEINPGVADEGLESVGSTQTGPRVPEPASPDGAHFRSVYAPWLVLGVLIDCGPRSDPLP